MSLQQIKEIIEKMEQQEQASAVYRRDIQAVLHRIREVRGHLSASSPNWIGQDLHGIEKFIEETLYGK